MEYKSEKVIFNKSAKSIFDKFSNISALKDLIGKVPEDKIPEDKRELLDKIELTDDSISIPGGPMGNIELTLSRVESPTLIVLSANNTPIPLSLALHIAPIEEERCELYVEINIGIPAMMAPMVSGPMKQMTQQISSMLQQLA